MIWRKISSGLMGGLCLNIGVERLGSFIMFECNAHFYSMEMILVKNSCIWFTFSKWKIGNSMASTYVKNLLKRFLKEYFSCTSWIRIWKRFNILKSGEKNLNVLNFKRYQREKSKRLQWIRLLYEVALIFLFFNISQDISCSWHHRSTKQPIFFTNFSQFWTNEKFAFFFNCSTKKISWIKLGKTRFVVW